MMTRLAAGLALALALSAGTAQSAAAMPGATLPAAALHGATSQHEAAGAAPGLTRVEYYCSPGFEPSYGGTCVAVPPRAEIELFVDQPLYAVETTRVVRRHHRRRYGLRERY